MSNSGTYPLFGSAARSTSHNKALRSADGTVTRPSRSSSSAGGTGRQGGVSFSPGSMRSTSSFVPPSRNFSGEGKQADVSDRIHRPASAGASVKTSDLLIRAPVGSGVHRILRSPLQTNDCGDTAVPAQQLLFTQSSLEKKFQQLERLHSELQNINSDIITGIKTSIAPTRESAAHAESQDVQASAEPDLQMSHIYDVLSTIKLTNDAIKTDFQRELEMLSQQLQTSLAENGELLRENLMLKDVISQKELHISDLTHFAKTKEKEVDRLNDLLSTAEHINNVKNIELKSYLNECANVSRHNESVLAERSSELQILQSTNEQLKMTLSITKQELGDSQEQLSKVRTDMTALQTERDELERRIKKVKTNAEKFITQRDTEISRLKECAQRAEQEEKSLRQQLKAATETLTSYKTEVTNIQTMLARFGIAVSFTPSEEAISLVSEAGVDAAEACPAIQKQLETILHQKNAEIAELRELRARLETTESLDNEEPLQNSIPHNKRQTSLSLNPGNRQPSTADQTINRSVYTECFYEETGTSCSNIASNIADTPESSARLPTSVRDLPEGPLADEIKAETQALYANIAAKDEQLISLRLECDQLRASAESHAQAVLPLNQKIESLQFELSRSEQLIANLRKSDKSVELAVLQAKYDALNDNKLDPNVLLSKYMEGEKRNEELRGKIYEALMRETELQKEKSELQASLSIAKAEYEILVRKSDELETSLAKAKASTSATSDLTSKVASLEADLSAANATITTLNKTIETLTQTCKTHEEVLLTTASMQPEDAGVLDVTPGIQACKLKTDLSEAFDFKEPFSRQIQTSRSSSADLEYGRIELELKTAKATEEDLRRRLFELENITREMNSKDFQIESLKKDLELANTRQSHFLAQVANEESLSSTIERLTQENESLQLKTRSLESTLEARPTADEFSTLKERLKFVIASENALKSEIALATQRYTELSKDLDDKVDFCASLQKDLDAVKAQLNEKEAAHANDERAFKNEIESLHIIIEEKTVFIAQLTSKLTAHEKEQGKLQALLDAQTQEAEHATKKVQDLEARLEKQSSSDSLNVTKLAVLSEQLAHVDEERKSLVGILNAAHKEVQMQAAAEKVTREHVVAIEERLQEANQEITLLQDQLRIAEHKLSHRAVAESAELLKLRDEIAFLTHKHRQELEECNTQWQAQLEAQKGKRESVTTVTLQQELDATTKTLDRVILAKNAEIQALKKQLNSVQGRDGSTLDLSERSTYEEATARPPERINKLTTQLAVQGHPRDIRPRETRTYADALEKSMSPSFTIPKYNQRETVFAEPTSVKEVEGIDAQIAFQPALTTSSPIVDRSASDHRRNLSREEPLVRSTAIQELLDRSRELNIQVGNLNIDMNYFHEKLDRSLDLTTSVAPRSINEYTSILQTKDLKESDLNISPGADGAKRRTINLEASLNL